MIPLYLFAALLRVLALVMVWLYMPLVPCLATTLMMVAGHLVTAATWDRILGLRGPQ